MNNTTDNKNKFTITNLPSGSANIKNPKPIANRVLIAKVLLNNKNALRRWQLKNGIVRIGNKIKNVSSGISSRYEKAKRKFVAQTQQIQNYN